MESRHDYLRAVHRAAAPGASLFVLAFAPQPWKIEGPGPDGFTAEQLSETVEAVWTVEAVRPANLYATDHTAGAGSADTAGRDSEGRIAMPGFILIAHKNGDLGR
ncbi:hypothetical protein HGA13_16225 [Nocardia speluncae]|uniref:SAM-dependent methyltransferase n=1 Tax=Nocardia speluncae TaxID=419477 RepID=A0A846XHC6_9NOCA|nr:hypothetical protein [Nocardia speluncae]